ncbi:MAG: DUF2863 family protein [Herminiimonas sp.]|nr:DUF2863 family protein [Herminiimonas sp.]
MRRPSKNSPHKLSAESQRLVMLAQGVVQAGSRLEARAWENALDAQTHKLLKSHHQAGIDHALDHLFTLEPDGYDALMEAVEAASESVVIEHEGQQFDALLIALPILAWTRFTIPSGPIAADALDTLAAHLYAHVLAGDTRLAMAPMLYAIDQLPRTPADTYALTHKMAQSALKGEPVRVATGTPETAPFLADTRYLLAAAVVPSGTPLFRWQASLDLRDRTHALEQWQAQALPNIVRLLPGCGIDLLLPQAYYIACREADRNIRPASIRAAVHYLTNTLEIEADALQAVIGSFGEDPADERIDEYRVSFLLADDTEVLYGIVWPLYGAEDAEQVLRASLTDVVAGSLPMGTAIAQAPIDEILNLLEESGIKRVQQHEERFPLEFCDDCGAPLYPDLEAELVHAEMPEDVPQATTHFH